MLFLTTAYAEDNDTADSSQEVLNRGHHKGERRDGSKGQNNTRDGDKRRGQLSSRVMRIIDADKGGQVSVEEYMAHV